MKTHRLLALLLALALLTLAACGQNPSGNTGDEPSSGPDHINTAEEPEESTVVGRWVLDTIEWQGRPINLGEMAEIMGVELAPELSGETPEYWMELYEDGSVIGETAGVPFSGSYALDGETLVITMGSYDEFYAWDGADRITTREEDLGLTAVLVRDDTAPTTAPDSPYVGVWLLESAAIGEESFTVAELATMEDWAYLVDAKLEIRADGTLSAFAGGEEELATYTPQGDDLLVSTSYTTERISLDGDRLLFEELVAEEVFVLVFVRSDEPVRQTDPAALSELLDYWVFAGAAQDGVYYSAEELVALQNDDYLLSAWVGVYEDGTLIIGTVDDMEIYQYTLSGNTLVVDTGYGVEQLVLEGDFLVYYEEYDGLDLYFSPTEVAPDWPAPARRSPIVD